MRQAEKSDIKIGTLVMVNYRNGGDKASMIPFRGATYQGYLWLKPIVYKNKVHSYIYPLMEIKEIDPDDDTRMMIGYGGQDYTGLVVFDEENDADIVADWRKYQELWDEVVKKHPANYRTADESEKWDYLVSKKTAKKFIEYKEQQHGVKI